MRRPLAPGGPPRTAPRRGLSLLEVLLALAILALSVAAISQLVDMGTDRGNEARVLVRGTRLAQSKMAEVEAGLIPVSSGTEGQFTGDDAAWSFQVVSSPVSTPASPPNLYTVTVAVTRTLKGRPAQVVLTQMLFDPTVMGSSAQAEVGTPTTGTGTSGSSTTGSATGTGGKSP
jgi:prepilin-type N-terminal cleavage/methylation domain-containing protein